MSSTGLQSVESMSWPPNIWNPSWQDLSLTSCDLLKMGCRKKLQRNVWKIQITSGNFLAQLHPSNFVHNIVCLVPTVSCWWMFQNWSYIYNIWFSYHCKKFWSQHVHVDVHVPMYMYLGGVGRGNTALKSNVANVLHKLKLILSPRLHVGTKMAQFQEKLLYKFLPLCPINQKPEFGF